MAFTLPTQTTIYRVMQEALTNIGKHAHPNQVSLEIKKQDERLPSTTMARALIGTKFSPTLGLLSMEEHIKMLVELWSQKKRGTRISFTIPLPREEVTDESGDIGS